MNFTKRILSTVAVLALLLGVLYAGNQSREQERESIFDHTKTLHIWYTDEALTDYLSSMAVRFNEENGVRVIPVLQSGLEFLEQINEASLTNEDTPDLYIASNDIMEKAYLAGLATEIFDDDAVVSTDNFPESAIYAVTYQQKLLGYPFYYETSALLYNKTYLEDMAKTQITEELEGTTGEEEDEEETSQTQEEAGEDTEDTGLSDEEMAALVEERLPSLIPTTFDELEEFAENYDAPENVEAVFKWDVSDIFYNYFFVGNYINVGGSCGDDTGTIDIYNENAIKALQVYQDLSQYFAIDADEVTYDSAIEEFMAGKIVMTTATTDIVQKLEEARENGEFAYDYGIATIPDLNEEMSTKGLSVTSTIYVNGYSSLKEEANQFAAYLVENTEEDLYTAAGKVSANKNISYENQNLNIFMDEYEDSVPMPKMMATSNFWVKMEIIFSNVWDGSSVNDELKSLSEEIKSQITGEVVEETVIQVEEEEDTEYTDYSDEDEETEEEAESAED
jgi:maltose-binding protein MalE